MSWGESLNSVSLFCLRRRSLQGERMSVFKYREICFLKGKEHSCVYCRQLKASIRTVKNISFCQCHLISRNAGFAQNNYTPYTQTFGQVTLLLFFQISPGKSIPSIPTCQSVFAQLLSTTGQTAFGTCSTNFKETCQKSPQPLTPQKPTILLFCAFLNSYLLHPLDLF